jgi:hypothetical protein
MKGFTLVLFFFSVMVSCKKEYSCETCLPGNSPSVNQLPIANAGADQTIILPQDSVFLDGSASTDQDGSISSYSWKNIDGPGPVTIKNAGSVKTIAAGLQEGFYLFQLSVSDNNRGTDEDTVRVQCVKNNSSTSAGFIFNKVWGCNDLCNDNDVYLTVLPGLNNFSDPNIPLEVFILDSASQQWIPVPRYTNSLPATSKYYYQIREKTLFVHVTPAPGASQLLGKPVVVRVRFL